MFGGLLRLELRRTMPADIAGLHQLAARWLAEHGQAADAIGHLQAAGDWDEAARMLTDHNQAASKATRPLLAEPADSGVQARPV
jgi:ATP/maltotriose-dependent transcriptional regulator MalT